MLVRDSLHMLVTPTFLVALLTACGPTSDSQTATGKKGGSDLLGPYSVVQNWPQPLPDTRHLHDGWTWGSTGAVFVGDRPFLSSHSRSRGQSPVTVARDGTTGETLASGRRG